MTTTATADPSTAADTPNASSTPALAGEAQRRAALRTMKIRATGLLVLITILYVVLVVTSPADGAWGYARAAAEAGMIGGLADWFAVTALFRHPLGLPIPHTAVIAERKDQFGETMGNFVQEYFLSPDIITDRMRTVDVAGRAAAWMRVPENAERLAGHVADLMVRAADVVKDEDVQELVETEVRSRLRHVSIAPLAGRVLRAATAEGRHKDVVDAMLAGLDNFLLENRDTLRERFGRESPWWLPDVIDDRIFDRLLDGVRSILDGDIQPPSMGPADPLHRNNGPVSDDVTRAPGDTSPPPKPKRAEARAEVRDRIDGWILDIAHRLEHSPEWQARGEQLQSELMNHPELRGWTASLWTDAKATLRVQASDPGSELRRRLADGIATVGERLADDADLTTTVNDVVTRAVHSVAEQFNDEVGRLIANTVARWDGSEASDRLELLLGRDLQFIRINGTVVGALAGVSIHALTEAFG